MENLREKIRALPYDLREGVEAFWEPGYDYSDPEFWGCYDPMPAPEFIKAVQLYDLWENAEATAEKYSPFVASLLYGAERVPMTVEEAEYTLDAWREENSVEIPEGFTAEIFAHLWNRFVEE